MIYKSSSKLFMVFAARWLDCNLWQSLNVLSHYITVQWELLQYRLVIIIQFQALRKQCQDFATALLDHTRSSYELEILLNYDPDGPAYQVNILLITQSGQTAQNRETALIKSNIANISAWRKNAS